MQNLKNKTLEDLRTFLSQYARQRFSPLFFASPPGITIEEPFFSIGQSISHSLRSQLTNLHNLKKRLIIRVSRNSATK